MSAPMRIESLAVKNYRCFRDVSLDDLPPMTVVVGANGSGKSTLFDVFAFLKDALARNVAYAVSRRGGYRELVSRGADGNIAIAVKLRESGGRRLAYRLEVGERDGQAVVKREVLSRHSGGERGRDWRLADFSEGSGMAITNESACGREGAVEKREEYELDAPDILAVKGLGQFRTFEAASALRSLIENWHMSDFRISDARRSAEAGCAEHLSIRGDNLAQVARHLCQNHSERFGRILDAMRRRVPGVVGVETKTTVDGRLVLRFQEGAFNDPFAAERVSDGAIKMFACLTLLYDPKPHPMLAVEEPENHLYPDIMRELSEEFRDYARRGGQVFVSTHSPDFLNGAKLNEIIWLFKKDGFTSARRASENELLRAFVAGGEPPGALWRQGVFEGILA